MCQMIKQSLLIRVLLLFINMPMRLDPRFYMFLSNHPEQPEKAIDRSQTKTMVLSDELPAKVANVSRDELRKYAQCKRVGNYLLGRTVGEGSFAKVKEAIHILTGEKVAIKIIDKNRARKDRYVSKNMRREARLLQMIRHPHIVQLLEIVETSQCYYLVFEFADGGDLMDHICKRKKLEEDEVRKFIRQVISAIEYLHRLGIMHRDLKVENLLLDANRNIKIIDFGLSNTIYSSDPNNENHCTTQCGSPAYAAPELLVRKDYGPQIDVWSIGVNLYAMLTGRLPYTVEPFNISMLYNKMLKRQMNVIPEYLSEACKDMIHQLLNPDPKERLHVLEAVRHRWITMDQRDPLGLIPCPNYLCEEDLDDRILDHVEEQLKLNSDDIIRDVIQNKATKNSCVYHLLVRRLERYEREQRKLITTPPSTIQIKKPKSPSSPEHKPTSTNHHPTAQKNGLVKRSLPKTHIMENPFKTIKVALIRQKKAAKKDEKSKSGKTSSQEPHSASTSEPVNKPKLCAIKRVALVKISPARRSLRGLMSSSRNSTNSPKPGRRRSYFEGLQQRRKSPKVRRRHAEPDDSFSSNASTPRKKSIDIADNVANKTQSMRIDDKINNNTVPNSKNSNSSVDSKTTVESSGTKSESSTSDNTLPLENIAENSTPIRDRDPASETVTHLYTDKGVVLRRDSSGENHKANYKQEQATVQHHVFHAGDKTGNTGDVKDEQGYQRINGVNSKHRTAGSGLSKVEMVNAKLSSIPAKAAETVKSTNQRLSSSNTPTSRQIPRNQTLKAKAISSKQTERKLVTPRRAPYKLDNSSKIPVLSGKNSALSRQSALSSTRLAPRTPTPSTANSRLPGTVARRNDVAKLADKYDKCVSVIVVDRSKDAGKGSANDSQILTAPGRGSATDGKSLKVAGKSSANDSQSLTAPGRGSATDGKSLKVAGKGSATDGKISTAAGKSSANDGNNTKGAALKVVGVSAKNNSTNGNGSNGKIAKVERVGVQKGSSLTVKEGNIEEKTLKGQEEKGKEIKEKTTAQNVERIRNGLQRPKIQADQTDTQPSLVKSAKESLVANTSRTTTKDSKQTVENTRRNSTNDRTGKVPTIGNPRPQRSSVKSQETNDTKAWTGDERRKISNYKKTNEPQQTKTALKREAKTATSVRSPAFTTS